LFRLLFIPASGRLAGMNTFQLLEKALRAASLLQIAFAPLRYG